MYIVYLLHDEGTIEGLGLADTPEEGLKKSQKYAERSPDGTASWIVVVQPVALAVLCDGSVKRA